MSRTLQHFVDNFLRGMEVGNKMQDRAEMRQYRRDSLEVARQKNKTAGDIHRDKMGIERDRANAYIDLARANAAKARAKLGGGAGAQGPQMSGALQNWTKEFGSGVPQEQPNYPPNYGQTDQDNTQVPEPRSGYAGSQTLLSDDEGGGGGEGGDGYARGGRTRMAAGGRSRRQALMGSIMQGANRGIQALNQPPRGTPPFNPNAPAPTITRGASTPVSPGAGSTGPGSGYGDNPAPPVTPTAIQTNPLPDMTGVGETYRRGGPVRGRRYEEGGSVDDDRLLHSQTGAPTTDFRMGRGRAMIGGNYDPNSQYMTAEAGYEHPVGRSGRIGVQGNYGKNVGPDGASAKPDWGVGIRGKFRFNRGGQVPRFDDGGNTTPQEGRIVYDEQGQPIWMTPTGPDEPYNPQYGGNKYGGAKPGGATFGGAKPGGATPGGATPGGGTYGGNTYGGWRHTRPTDAVTHDPGETGGPPEQTPYRPTQYDASDYENAPPKQPGQTMPPVVVTGSRDGGGGGRGAIDTRWKPLRDQTREAAYNPEKDLFDPENIHAVDKSGQTKSALSGAVDFADKTFHQKQGGNVPGQIQGQGGGEGGQPGPGIGADPRQQQLAQRGKDALYSGVGAPDQKMMDNIFKTIDPENKMSMDQKMMAAVTAVHAFHIKEGKPDEANKAAFEVAQYANSQARNYAATAMKQMQSGDHQGAINSLITGYNQLPDGHTATYENGNLVLRDQTGKSVANYVMDERAMKNIALGMATGQLGWDVIRQGATIGTNLPSNPPQGGRPSIADDLGKPGGPSAAPVGPPGAPPQPGQPQQAAQPQAAPAGPAQTPAAPTAPTATPPTTAGGPGMAPAPTAPTPQPTQVPQPPPAASAPPQAPAQPPGAARSSQPAPPAKPAPTATPTATQTQTKPGPTATTSGSAGATQSTTGTATTGGGKNAGEGKTAVDTTKTVVNKDEPKVVTPEQVNQAKADYWKDDPYKPTPGIRRSVAQDPKEEHEVLALLKQKDDEYKAYRTRMLVDAENKGIMKTSQGSAYVQKVIAARDKEHDEMRKGIAARLGQIRTFQQGQDRHEQEKVLAPRNYTPEQLTKAHTDFESQRDARIADADRSYRGNEKSPEGQAAVKRKLDLSNSVLRYAKDPKDQVPLNRVAAAIWEANGNISAKEAYDAALSVTSIMRDGPDGKEQTGENRQKGKNAIQFTPHANLRRGITMELPDGRAYHISPNGYKDVVGLHKTNWQEYAKDKEKYDKQKTLKEKAKAAISVLAPRMLSPIGMGVASGG
jgi:hypothetical protein